MKNKFNRLCFSHITRIMMHRETAFLKKKLPVDTAVDGPSGLDSLKRRN